MGYFPGCSWPWLLRLKAFSAHGTSDRWTFEELEELKQRLGITTVQDWSFGVLGYVLAATDVQSGHPGVQIA